jgi:hypothetical protein
MQVTLHNFQPIAQPANQKRETGKRQPIHQKNVEHAGID